MKIGFKKFSTKVIMMAIIVFCIVLVLLIALLTYRETRFMEENFSRRGQDMLTGVRESSRIALLAEDNNRLDTISHDYMKHRQEILYMVFYRYDWERIYIVDKVGRFPRELENIGNELKQLLSQDAIEWKDDVIIRNNSKIRRFFSGKPGGYALSNSINNPGLAIPCNGKNILWSNIINRL